MSALHSFRGSFLLALIVLFLSTASVRAMPTDWLVSGYVQGRFTQDVGEKGAVGNLSTPTDSIDVKRAYLQVHVKLTPNIGASILVQGNWSAPTYDVNGKNLSPVASSTTTSSTSSNATIQPANPDKAMIQEAYAEYIYDDFQTRAGMSRIPFGYEVPLSSAKLITTERSQIMQTQIYPFWCDRGAFAYYLPSTGANVSLGITDGQPQDNPCSHHAK